MSNLDNEQEKSRFTTFEEIKDIKILSTEEISKLNEADRDTLVQDAVQNLDEYTRSKYVENKRKIIFSSLLVLALFIVIIGTIAIVVYKILNS
ncbi:hypothetical protein MBOVJF4428_00521 [Mycoplasmopsis agalactiae]|uniref:Uncharacterized protein n=1 Tax=Mycoplasmopsis agalactiae (strain NCTC 10123 / CIP 59.7 / PG2) TaxID=347257 RepID=A5IXS1_MYCAP|nr:hypothetical protein [Mycoplasmopsis agalactiae]MCE6056930.1 hypothetical protein [Mycoplasmopsis agalactiae]MCE6078716.1 hypothetical protein [Mycoplasmopsis agalactiae]MCE6095103.1 hypothetical protein [Mycoplasmopsis agalactiae]MCE6114354.1 hypothetical protein [Mycoplasmopsis agalactiae]MCE6115008.1 hypothetical protein [Mycoplasmopsis agalactiae]